MVVIVAGFPGARGQGQHGAHGDGSGVGERLVVDRREKGAGLSPEGGATVQVAWRGVGLTCREQRHRPVFKMTPKPPCS